MKYHSKKFWDDKSERSSKFRHNLDMNTIFFLYSQRTYLFIPIKNQLCQAQVCVLMFMEHELIRKCAMCTKLVHSIHFLE